MTTANVISTALDSIKARRSEVEAQIAALSAEQETLRKAEEALIELVVREGSSESRQRGRPRGVRNLAEGSRERIRRGPGGTSVKAAVLAALKEAGEEGLHRDELGKLFAHVADGTLNTTLSVLKREGQVDSRRTGSGRKSTWHFSGEEDSSGEEGGEPSSDEEPQRLASDTPRVTSGRHGVSLPAVSI